MLNYSGFRKATRRNHIHVHTLTLCEYLQGDVSLRPVLEVREQQVGVSVDKVDADQLLAAWTPKLWWALAEGTASSLHTRGVVLAVGQLAQGQRRRRNLTQLTAAERKDCFDDVRKAEEAMLCVLNLFFFSPVSFRTEAGVSI